MWIQVIKDSAKARSRGGEPPPAGSWARFGDETLLLSEEAEGSASRAPARGASTRGRRVDASRDELHVVVQNGRLFQQLNPDVPVIHDRGRYLLVQVAPKRA